MGKRSEFERREADFYPTPWAAMLLLRPYLDGIKTFAEPCCGEGDLVRHLEGFGLSCVYSGDISTGQDAFALKHYNGADAGITNPPLTRRTSKPYDCELLHDLHRSFPEDCADYADLVVDPLRLVGNRQAAKYLPHCSDIVVLPRLKWITNTEAHRQGRSRLV